MENFCLPETKKMTHNKKEWFYNSNSYALLLVANFSFVTKLNKILK